MTLLLIGIFGSLTFATSSADAQFAPGAPVISVSNLSVGSGDVCTQDVVVSAQVSIDNPEGINSYLISANGVDKAEVYVGVLSTDPPVTSFSDTVEIVIEGGAPSGDWEFNVSAKAPPGSSVQALASNVEVPFTLPGNCPDNGSPTAVLFDNTGPSIERIYFEESSVSLCDGPAENILVVELGDVVDPIESVWVEMNVPGPSLVNVFRPTDPYSTRIVIPVDIAPGSPLGTWWPAFVIVLEEDGDSTTLFQAYTNVWFTVNGCEETTPTPSPDPTAIETISPTPTGTPIATPSPDPTTIQTISPTPSGTPIATPSPESVVDSSQTPTPTLTPVPTPAAPTPTAPTPTLLPVAPPEGVPPGLAYTGSNTRLVLAIGLVAAMIGLLVLTLASKIDSDVK